MKLLAAKPAAHFDVTVRSVYPLLLKPTPLRRKKGSFLSGREALRCECQESGLSRLSKPNWLLCLFWSWDFRESASGLMMYIIQIQQQACAVSEKSLSTRRSRGVGEVCGGFAPSFSAQGFPSKDQSPNPQRRNPSCAHHRK